MVSDAIEKQVVTLPALGEILLGVINDPIRADGSDHVHIPRTAYAGHLCAERLGDLHRERTHASRRTVNQDLLARLNLSLVAQDPARRVNAAMGTEAACSNVTLSGLVTNADSEAHAYSAKAPRHEPNTSSPGLNCVTFLPTASTWPATSTPSRCGPWVCAARPSCEGSTACLS